MSKYYVKTEKRNIKKYIRLAGLLLVASGILSLGYFFFPLISYQLFLAPVFASANIEVPIPKYLVVKENNFGGLLSQGFSALTHDYTDARNWYPAYRTADSTKISSYTLAIPKLHIDGASVSTVDYDLSKHLVHYAGTANPGEKGTAVIFGHSTLPAWFDPKDYKTIFATLHTLKTGDEMIATIDGLSYKYKIFSITITDPEDTNIFLQSYDNHYITLVTCTPPGTVWKRLIVRASLQQVH